MLIPLDAQILKSLKEKVHKLPMQPGVYIMKDKNNTVIYVGKAKKLKNRVSSYPKQLGTAHPI